MLADLKIIFVWWASLFGIGLVFLPLSRRLFSRFFDQGYLFAKVLGILFSSYLVWLLASLKILPFSSLTIYLSLGLGLLGNLLLWRRHSSLSKPPWIAWLAEEGSFFLALTVWSFVRGFQPDIQGLEKFMDFGFVNSILRSQYFPPADMWFAGQGINYYYFGHFVAAFLTKLTGLDSAVTYNLMIALLFAFTFSLTFSLTGNLAHFFLKQKFENLKTLPAGRQVGHWKLVISAGLLSALLLSLGANLHPAYYNLKMSLGQPYCDGSLTYWYPNATRYIGYCPNVDDKTIHEFPSYSFIVSDLHGHVSDIPFVLLFLALCLNLLLLLKESRPKTFNFELLTFNLLPTSLVLAAMYMTNQWDFPIYLLILGLVLLAIFYHQWRRSLMKLAPPLIYGGLTLLLALPLLLPFQLNFDPIVKGIAFVHAHSLPHQLLILWGVPWLFAAAFVVFLIGEARNRKNLLITDIFTFVLLAVATFLVIIPEIVYVKDIYIDSYHRANTVFKLTYQSFILYAIAMGYIFARLASSIKNFLTHKLTVAVLFLFFSALMVYPFYSLKGYYGELKKENYKTLFGLQFLKKLYPDDFRAVAWFNQNVKGQPVILEAVGDSYTDYERVSMATGLPTVQGWLVHEWLWRGSFDEPGKRSAEVQTIYESTDLSETKKLLQKYHVKFVIVGELERQKYSKLNEGKFSRLGKKVFESGKTVVFELS
jgi:uncharacterized membrane protein